MAKNKFLSETYDYNLIEGGFAVFNHEIPKGPIQGVLDINKTIVAYYDYYELDVKYKKAKRDDLSFCFFLVPDHREYWMAIHAISLFNRLDYPIVLYCSRKNYHLLKEISNENIKVIALQDFLPRRLEISVVVTYSLGAIYFIKRRIPVVVLGPHGVGGLITPNTFDFLHKYSFLGRPHGILWEPLPKDIFSSELMNAIRRKDIERIIEQNYQLVSKLQYLPFSKVGNEIGRLARSCRKINSTTKKWYLIPKISKNVEFKHSENEIYVRSKYLNNVIAQLDSVHFLLLIDGNRSFKDVFNLSGLDKIKFWHIVNQLIDLKIIDY